ncbi:MAG: diguanylate cyclase [Candidatus Brocadiia bacterium]|nr:diguanylate cyclase [Candidatus Brocadiia bacterium]
MRLSEKFYRDLLDTMQEGVFIVAADGLIEYWSRGAETISGYSSAEMRGRHGCEEGNLHLDEAGSPLGDEDCPLTRTLADGLARSADIHQRRRDGSLVPVQVRTGPVHDEEGNRVGAAELFADDTTRKEILGLITEVEDLALLDPLTALPNRVLLAWSMQERMHSLRRYSEPFGVLLVDIDRFKSVNDEPGHLAGDEMLRAMARTLAENLRNSDVVGRWGGDEFLALLPYADEGQLISLGERLRRSVEETEIDFAGSAIRVWPQRPQDARRNRWCTRSRPARRCSLRKRAFEDGARNRYNLPRNGTGLRAKDDRRGAARRARPITVMPKSECRIGAGPTGTWSACSAQGWAKWQRERKWCSPIRAGWTPAWRSSGSRTPTALT